MVPSATAIDDLEYTYDSGNRLKKVKDNTGNPSGFKEGVYTGDAFIYDNYGNLTQDKNKGITAITYNHLNLPKKIEFGGNRHIVYLYNALGQKVRKTVTNGSTVTRTDYQSGFHYENEVLKFFATAEGYAGFSTRGFYYVYNYTDHLGNIRLSYTNDSSFGLLVVEENNYYPFGLKHNGYNNISPPNNVYKYKFGQKEWQDELGLNLYDFEARNYMPDIGRTTTLDPMAEMYYSTSPYAFFGNNPVFWTDPTGMTIEPGSQKEWDKQTANVEKRRDKLQAKIDKRTAKAEAKGWSADKLAGKLGNLNERVSSLNNTISTFKTLEASDQVYSLSKIGATDIGGVTYDPSSGNVVISYANTSNFAHESTHAGQFESRDIAFDSNTGNVLAQDIYDEVAAYKAQYAYKPSSVSGLKSTSGTKVNSFNSITPSWVQGLDGGTLYNLGGRANTGVSPLNINSTKADFLKAYPNNPALNTLPSNFTLKTSYPSIYYKK